MFGNHDGDRWDHGKIGNFVVLNCLEDLNEIELWHQIDGDVTHGSTTEEDRLAHCVVHGEVTEPCGAGVSFFEVGAEGCDVLVLDAV